MTLQIGQDPTKTTVAIFGGGVAGLTAAHELGRRGFQVTLYEATNHLGGMAASQYADAPTNLTDQAKTPVPPDTAGAFAGEHGFRFFPAFYRHLGDTLKRIPLAGNDDSANGPITQRMTVADRLLPTNTQGVALNDGRDLFTYKRGKVDRSLEAVLDELATTMDYLGATDQDIFRLLFKLVEYMSSSIPRREELEKTNWYTFVEGDKFSPRMREYIDTVPRALVAMSAKEADARTQGNTLLQLALDQMGDPDEVDRTLDGPTTERWIRPWVRFLQGSLPVKIQRNVSFQGFEQDPAKSLGEMQAITSAGPVSADAFVLAIPHHVLTPILQAGPLDLSFLAAQDYSTPVWDDSLARLEAFPDQLMPAGPMALLSGIQYYLPADVKFVPGHVYYPDSLWGLSSISQAQFWGEAFPDRFARGGVLSVDIGDFDTKGLLGRSVKECTPQQIADEVWEQLRVATAGNQFLRVDGAHTRWPGVLPPKPPSWMLDRYLEFEKDISVFPPVDGKFLKTDAQMLINRPGEYVQRPGHPDLYRVHLGQFVLAGPWMQTYTRLTTMEAANESARHAVNAILAGVDFQGEYCTIWNPEDHEPVPFERMKSLDERLVACGLPHVFQALGLYEWIDCWIPTTPYTHEDLGTHTVQTECDPPNRCEPSPLDQLQAITGLDLHQLSELFELCPEDLKEAERRVKNAAVDAKAADFADVRSWLEGRQVGAASTSMIELLQQLAGRELSEELLSMMQESVQAVTDARMTAQAPDRAFDERTDVPDPAPLSALGRVEHARLMRVAGQRLERRYGQQSAPKKAAAQAVGEQYDEPQGEPETDAEPSQDLLAMRLELAVLDDLARLYVPGYLSALLDTERGAAWFEHWIRSAGDPEEPVRPEPGVPVNVDALAEADKRLRDWLPRPPAGAKARPVTRFATHEGATDGHEGEPEASFITQDLPPETFLSSEIVPRLPRVRRWRRRRGRALPRLLASLTDRGR